MSPPTKLPDEFFPDDDWLRADYAGRINLLLSRFHAAREEAREAWETVSKTAMERDAALCGLEATGMKLAAALIEIGTYKMTTHPTEGAGK